MSDLLQDAIDAAARSAVEAVDDKAEDWVASLATRAQDLVERSGVPDEYKHLILDGLASQWFREGAATLGVNALGMILAGAYSHDLEAGLPVQMPLSYAERRELARAVNRGWLKDIREYEEARSSFLRNLAVMGSRAAKILIPHQLLLVGWKG